MGKPREELWDFEETIYRHRPNDAGYYFLVRYGRNNQIIRAPESGAWRAREPFDEPIAPGGAWFVQYCKDSHGRERVHPIGKLGPLRVVLRWPSEADESAGSDAATDAATDAENGSASAKKGASDGDLLKLLTGGLEEDDAEGSVKGVRIEARKMELAMQQKAQIYDLGKHNAFASEVVDCLKTNEFMRQQLRDQAAINTQIQRESGAMLERTMVLFEQLQQSAGRQNEREREAALRVASPPPPPDYTPVLQCIVSTFRDIGVAALQRDSRPRAPALDAGSAAKAALGAVSPPSGPSTSSTDPSDESLDSADPPSPLDALSALRAQVQRASAGPILRDADSEPPTQPAKSTARPSYEELQAQCEKLRADVAAAEVRKTQPAPLSVLPAQPVAAAATAAPAAAPTAVLQPEPEIGDAKKPPAGSLPVAPVPIAQSVPPKISMPTPVAAEPKEPPSAREQTSTQAVPASPPVALGGPTSASSRSGPQPATPPEDLRAFAQSELVQGILVNMHASRLLESDEPIPPPLVVQAKQVEKVLLDPPKMDPETARRLLKDGSTLESFGAFLFFNPMIRDALLGGRGK